MNANLVSEIRADIAVLEAEILERQKAVEGAKAYLLSVLSRSPKVEPPSLSPEPLLQFPPAGNAEYSENSSAIRAAIEACPPDYTIYDIEKILATRGMKMKRETVSQSLSRFRRQGKIAVKKPGAGRAPTIYTKEVPTS